MAEVLFAIALYVAFLVVVIRCLRANGDDTDAEQAADSVRAALDADARFDELRTYTQRPHVKAMTEAIK
jgi:hypothetical protein